LKDGSRSATGAHGRRWTRALVVVEVALACAVLMASALLVRSVSRMLHTPIGVSRAQLVTATLQLPYAGYPTWLAVDHGYQTLLDSIRAQPGVIAAGATSMLPLDPGWRLPFSIEGRPAPASDYTIAQHVCISSGYLETVGATMIAGRTFTAEDRADTEPVVIVNETFARSVFPGQNALEHRLVSTAGPIGPLGMNVVGRGPFRIVGVVADVHQAPLAQRDEPVIYHTLRQFPYRPMTLVARGADESSVVSGLRTALRAMDPTLPLSNVSTIDERVRTRAAAPRLLMAVLMVFAGLTGTLAAVGVYGLLACVVNDRRRELAIRLALGAKPGSLARLVTAQGIGLAAIGIAIGLGAAQLAQGLLGAVLFRTRTTDVGAAAVSGALLLSAAAIACLAPAIRAARVAPIEGLKSE